MNTNISSIMKHIRRFLILMVGLMLTGCNDWLDIKPAEQERENDLYEKVNGFKGALAGCYATLAEQSVYGRNLTMTDIDCLAGLWSEPSETYRPVWYYLYHHQYDNTETRDEIKDIYKSLFNVVTQANFIIQHIEGSDGQVIRDVNMRNVINGEAYGIRALCQFDILRLFGQMPQNAQRKVSLPYSEVTGIETMPAYYSFNEYVAKLESDLNKAEQFLLQSAPENSYSPNAPSVETNDNPADRDVDFLSYRNHRMNLWAVKALKARLYLYLGQMDKAYKEAKEVLEANSDGAAYMTLTTRNDYLAGYYNTPNECLLAISCDQLGNYASSTLGGDASVNLDANNILHISTAMYSQMYPNTQSDIRYSYLWEQTKSGSLTYPTLKKYYYDTSATYDLAELLTRREIVPIIRLSEIYLILMETTTDLSEANTLYRDYMKARNVNITTDFTSLKEVKSEVVNEYMRDFYGEGVMFYVYKRLGMETMKWFSSEKMGEEQYILPLPSSEFDPSTKSN